MLAQKWIDALELAPHPEGGVYVQTYADTHSTAIYYLLRAGEQSAWHRVAERTEVWHHYAGAPLRLDVSVDGANMTSSVLGSDIGAEQRPQVVVPPGAWQAAVSLGDWTLVGCTVAPPFTFASFELAPTGWQPGAFGPLVSAGWLAEHADEVAIVDVRWYLDGRSGREAYECGHLPGAVWLDLDAVLAAPPSAGRGRHPLPTPERFASGLCAAGIGDGTPVVAYDDSGGMSAARLVWLLRALGHPAALLDGGLAAWDGPLDTGTANPTPDVFTPQPWPSKRLVELESVTAARHLLDARAPERFRGDEEPVDSRAGHIPGAANTPWMANLTASGRFAPARQLREQFGLPADADASQIVVYCGSGVSACHTLLALEAAGIERAKLYPGSWSQWSSDPERPAVTGDAPG